MDISRFLNLKNKKQLMIDMVIWFVWGMVLLLVGNSLSQKCLPWLQKYAPPTISLFSSWIIQSPEPVRIAAFFLSILVLFVLCKDVWVRFVVLRNKDKNYIFNNKDWPNKWIFNGKTELTSEGYLFIKSSRAGNLLKKHYWKDFKMSFEMRFLNKQDKKIPNYQRRLGLVFRAEDLDNYFMIEIGKCVENSIELSVKPHIRYGGGWEWMGVEEVKNPEHFDFSNFIKVSLEVRDDTALLFYDNTPVFKWELPTHVDINHIESGVRYNEQDSGDKRDGITPGKSFAGHVQDIQFRLKHGLVGFRAYMKHGAIIRELKIKPLIS